VPDVLFLAEAILFPRLATDRMRVENNLNRPNPGKRAIEKNAKNISFQSIKSMHSFVFSIQILVTQESYSSSSFVFGLFVCARAFLHKMTK
jgi:hypothetical protein